MTDDLAGLVRAVFGAPEPELPHDEAPEFGALLRPGRIWLRRLAAEGLGVPAWPSRCGGRGASPEQAAEIRRLLAARRPPDLYPFSIGTGVAGPVILDFGSRDQQHRWLSAIARGERIVCQMFSEPEAGSDLANVSTIARPTDGGWSLSGQKVWTSRAIYADWGLCLARTDTAAPKHSGLTMFVVPMRGPGVDVRPLRQMNGDLHFSEVFLDDVRLDDRDRLGAVGAGWPIAVAALGYERASIVGYGGGSRRRQRGVPDWLEDLASAGRLADPVLRDQAMRAYILERVQRFAALPPSAGAQRPSGGSGGKLRQVAAFKACAEVLVAAAGAHGMLGDCGAHETFLVAPSMSIRGGTDQIQRNVIAERVLGLPAETRFDRDVPWSRSRSSLI
jgi:alkylation response protein AidB-like acyl-CoA dehydrogenase